MRFYQICQVVRADFLRRSQKKRPPGGSRFAVWSVTGQDARFSGGPFPLSLFFRSRRHSTVPPTASRTSTGAQA